MASSPVAEDTNSWVLEPVEWPCPAAATSLPACFAGGAQAVLDQKPCFWVVAGTRARFQRGEGVWNSSKQQRWKFECTAFLQRLLLACLPAVAPQCTVAACGQGWVLHGFAPDVDRMAGSNGWVGSRVPGPWVASSFPLAARCHTELNSILLRGLHAVTGTTTTQNLGENHF